jgi:hypothetical protein
MRRLAIALAVVAALGVAAWHWQSQLIGLSARGWLGWVASSEARHGGIERRRGILVQLNRALLMPPPPDALVAELFELVHQLSSRVATGEISLPWAAWIYTTYEQDMLRDRPGGQPPRAPDAVATELARLQQFYAIQHRPDVPGITVGDVLGTGDDTISLDEIEQADRSGQAIDLRRRGAH